MKVKPIISFLLIVFSWFPTNAQDSTALRYTESISFAEGFGGFRSEILTQVEDYYRKKNYDAIVQLMYSESTADQFLASIMCEQMVKDRKIVLSSLQYGKMKLIQSSEENLSFNSGCTCREVITINDYFTSKNPCGFQDQMKWWLENLDKPKKY